MATLFFLFDQVIDCNEQKQYQQKCYTYLLNDHLDFDGHFFSHDSFDDDEHEMSAIQSGKWENIDDCNGHR